MNTESIQTRNVGFGEITQVGDVAFDEDFSHIYIWLPGTSGPDAIPIQKGPAPTGRVWGWDGNVEKPTITPSINYQGHWHGYLEAGFLKSC